MKLAKITSELFRQANRLLTNMTKRAKSDSNVQHALDLAREDIGLFSKGKSTKFGVNSSMNEKNLKSMVRAAEQLLNSPYSRQKSTDALYRQQRKTFGERYGLTPKQTKQIVDLFDAKKNPKTAEAWESIKDKVEYNAIVPHLRDGKLADVANDLGTKKLGLMLRLYVESGLSGDMDLIQYLSDTDYYNFFKNNDNETISDFVNNRLYER